MPQASASSLGRLGALLAGLALFALYAAGQVLWIRLDQWPLSSDPVIHYAHLQSLDWTLHHRPADLLPLRHDFPPLLYLATLPLAGLRGMGADTALLSGLLFAALLFGSTYGLARAWLERDASLAAAALVLAFPANLALSRLYFTDFALEAAVALALALLARRRSFGSPGRAAGLGAAWGAGMLVKWTFPLFVVAPAVVVLLRGWRQGSGRPRETGEAQAGRKPENSSGIFERSPDATRRPPLRPLVGLAAALAAALLVALPWYLGSADLVLGRFRLAGTQNPITLPGGLAFDPFYYWLRLPYMLSLPGTLLVLGGAWAVVRRVGRGSGLLLWALVAPLVLLSFMPARWPRYLAPALPGAAVLGAALLARRERSGPSSPAADGRGAEVAAGPPSARTDEPGEQGTGPPAAAGEGVFGAGSPGRRPGSADGSAPGQGRPRAWRRSVVLLIAGALLYAALFSFTPLSEPGPRLAALFFPGAADLELDIARPSFQPLDWPSRPAVERTLDLLRSGSVRPVCLVAPYTQFDFNAHIFRYLAVERHPGYPLVFHGSFRGRVEPPRSEPFFEASYFIHQPGALLRQRAGRRGEALEPVAGTARVLGRLLEAFPERYRALLEIPMLEGNSATLYRREGTLSAAEAALILESLRESGPRPREETSLLARLLLALGRRQALAALGAEEEWLAAAIGRWQREAALDPQGRLPLDGPRALGHAAWGLALPGEAEAGGGAPRSWPSSPESTSFPAEDSAAGSRDPLSARPGAGAGGEPALGGGGEAGLDCLGEEALLLASFSAGRFRNCRLRAAAPAGLEGQELRLEAAGQEVGRLALPADGTPMEADFLLPGGLGGEDPVPFRLSFRRRLPPLVRGGAGWRPARETAARLIDFRLGE